MPSIIAKGRTHYICKKRVTDLELLQEIDDNPSKIDRICYDNLNDYEWNKININKCEFRECKYYNSCSFLELREKIRTFQGAIICNHDLLLENQGDGLVNAWITDDINKYCFISDIEKGICILDPKYEDFMLEYIKHKNNIEPSEVIKEKKE